MILCTSSSPNSLSQPLLQAPTGAEVSWLQEGSAAEMFGVLDGESSGDRMLLVQLPESLPLRPSGPIDLTTSSAESKSGLEALTPGKVSAADHCG